MRRPTQNQHFFLCLYLWCTSALLICSFPLLAQQTAQASLSVRSPSALFVHFDKNIYTNNETVWFTGYLLKAPVKELNLHHLMSVALVRDIDSSIVKQENYQLSDGFSYGSMALPDTMVTGNYHFLVTTNLVQRGLPLVSFVQPILIKTSIDPAFRTSIRFLDKNANKNNEYSILLSVTTREDKLLPRPAEVTYRYGTSTMRAKTNLSGELVFPVKLQTDITDPIVYVKVKYGRDSSFVQMPITAPKQTAMVRFYPEGGNLNDQIPGYVGWEVNDGQSGSVTTKALLYKDNEIIDTVETGSNGMGKFSVNPDINSIYHIRLLHSGFKDTLYSLPKVNAGNLGIIVKSAVTEDTLVVLVRTAAPQKIGLRVQDSRNTYIDNEIDINAGRIPVKIFLGEVPKGLHTLTVYDSLGRPLAERMFFAHYSSKTALNLITDSTSYAQRQKVHVKLNLKGQDTLAVVSIACVQNNRISLKNSTDIESYSYLTEQLSRLPLSAGSRLYTDKEYMEQILLTRGWRRYTWQDYDRGNLKDTTAQYEEIPFKMSVTRFGKPLKKPVIVVLVQNQQLSYFKTDQNGLKMLSSDSLLTEAGKKIMAFVANKNQAGYEIRVENPFLKLNQQYLRNLPATRLVLPSLILNNDMLSLNKKERAISLKEVKIIKRIDRAVNAKMGPNPCGDYVCQYNILNCPNHMGNVLNTQPIVGRQYRNGRTNSTITYQECREKDLSSVVFSVDGVYTKKEFYVNDFSQPLEPAFVSTVYWNHALILPAEGRELSFYTSDITGSFKLIVQGITANSPVYAEGFFEVREKK
jgi:hypothetical protein